LCLVAEGAAHLYPRLAPTCEWDTAAAQAIVEHAGGLVLTPALKPLEYGQREDLLNPYFIVCAAEGSSYQAAQIVFGSTD
jgi:3'(2'), 5'-bisphosphate nucleotidase